MDCTINEKLDWKRTCYNFAKEYYFVSDNTDNARKYRISLLGLFTAMSPTNEKKIGLAITEPKSV